MKHLLRYFVPYLPWLMVLVVLVYGQVYMTLMLPDYMADIANKGIIGGDMSAIFSSGIGMLGAALLAGVCTIGVSFLGSRIAAGFVRRLRSALFETVENFSLTEFMTFSTASLITRATNDMQQLQQTLAMLLRMALMAPFMAVGAIMKAYEMSPDMSWIMAVAIVALVIVIVILFSIAVPKFKLIQKMVDRLNLVTREMLTGARVIRSFRKESFEKKRFDAVNQESIALNIFVNRAMIIMQPAMTLIMSFTSLAVVWIGAQYVEAHELALGDMLAFMQYATQAVTSFLMLSFLFFLVPRAMVSAERIGEVLGSTSPIQDPDNPVTIPKKDGSVIFDDVTFRYADSADPVLQHISFTAHAGKTTAIIGGTGSGKTTLMNLIPRLYDVSEGKVSINGVDVRDARQADVRDRIGYATQKATLFSGTIQDNIAYGRAPTDKEVKHAAKVAQAADFIKALPDGYASDVAQGGTNFSGGQKQRLAIARVIARQPDIYLFDDTFSALDTRTDAKLRAALAKETKGKTVIIVAQRISSIMHANTIIVLDSGEIIAKGTHDELMQSSAVYQEIAQSQLSQQELEEDV